MSEEDMNKRLDKLEENIRYSIRGIYCWVILLTFGVILLTLYIFGII